MRKGFTLAELLIALAILGVIATFTIPKVLQSQQDERSNSIAKEAAGAVLDAFASAKAKGEITTSSTLWSLSPYLNYVKVETGLVDNNYGTTGSVDCSAAYKCLRLHNGAVLVMNTTPFNAADRMLWFDIDPDGVYNGTANGPGKSITFWLFYNGKLRTYASLDPGSPEGGGGVYNPDVSKDPPWFSWN